VKAGLEEAHLNAAAKLASRLKEGHEEARLAGSEREVVRSCRGGRQGKHARQVR
jgi:hypothetical protein